jgi:hypothetical protein
MPQPVNQRKRSDVIGLNAIVCDLDGRMMRVMRQFRLAQNLRASLIGEGPPTPLVCQENSDWHLSTNRLKLLIKLVDRGVHRSIPFDGFIC